MAIASGVRGAPPVARDPSLSPWSVQEAEYYEADSASEQFRFFVRYAILAPSGHNTQPWRFVLRDDALEIRADRTRALPVVDPEDRELTMSCGAALLNLRLALRAFGYDGEVAVLPEPGDPDHLARVRLGRRQPPTAEEDRLFRAIPRRRTNRLGFEPREVPPSLLDSLVACAHQEGAWLEILRGREARLRVANLVAEGDRRQAQSPSFRRELASWVHPNRSSSRDGMPGYAFGMGDLKSYLGPLYVGTVNWGPEFAARDRAAAVDSPVLAVLGTAHDDPAAWLAAGQALGRVLLRARAAGVWGSFLNQPVELPDLRLEVARLVSMAGYPQLILRLGYGSEPRPTPRRDLSEVLEG